MNERFISGWCWAQGLFWAVTPLLGFSRFRHEGPGFWCDVAMEQSSASVWYTVTLFLSSYFIPLTLIIFCYVKINLKIKEVHLSPFTKLSGMCLIKFDL